MEAVPKAGPSKFTHFYKVRSPKELLGLYVKLKRIYKTKKHSPCGREFFLVLRELEVFIKDGDINKIRIILPCGQYNPLRKWLKGIEPEGLERYLGGDIWQTPKRYI